MKLSEGASTTATTTAVRDVACEMRSFFFLHPSPFPFFFPLLYFVSLPLPEACVLPWRGFRSPYVTTSVPFSFDDITLRALLLQPRRDVFAGRRVPKVLRSLARDSAEMGNVRISDFHGFPLSHLPRLYLIFLSESAFVFLSILPSPTRCLHLREFSSRLLLFLSFLSVLCLFFFTPSRIPSRINRNFDSTITLQRFN